MAEQLLSKETEEQRNRSGFFIARENDRGYQWITRFLDILVSGVVIVGLLPVWLLIALIIYVDDPKGSPLFIQERIGLNGRPFRMLKFRSMVVDAEKRLEVLRVANECDGPAFKIQNDPRITRFGRFIRKTSIDEFPQMINVLKGEMSLVGPRPPLRKEVEQYTPYQYNRLTVKPGLTCYWQVAPNRHDMKFDDWVELDLKYIRERSFGTNVKIIFKTIAVVLNATGE